MSHYKENNLFESIPVKYQSFVTGLVVFLGCVVFGALQLALWGAFKEQEHYTFQKYEPASVLYSRAIESAHRLNMHIQVELDDGTNTWIVARNAKYFALAGDKACVEIKSGDNSGKKIFAFSGLENC